MKKAKRSWKNITLMSLLLVFMVQNTMLSQTYLPMLQDDVTWGVDFNLDPFGGGPSGIISTDINVGGETIIDGRSYKSVFNDGTATGCLVREDNGLVWRYNEDTGEDVLIYDFTLEVGDQFIIPEMMYSGFCAYYEFFNGDDEMNVVEVTSEMIAGEMRKVITFDYWSEAGFNAQWIEGIGSNLGFDPVGDIIDIGSHYLVCYTKDGVTTFFNGATSCENTVLGTSDVNFVRSYITPNPIADQAYLIVPTSMLGSDLIVYDMQGRIKEQDLLDREAHIINGMDYASGIYLYQIRSKGIVQDSGKFVVR